MKAKCPHCGGEINPASMLGKESVKYRDTSPERMSEIGKLGAQARWGKE